MALTKVTGDFIETGSITQGHLHSSHGITLDHIGDGSTNTFFTTANARAAISATGSLSYNNSTGVMSFTMPTLNTTNITEGDKLFFTNARAIGALTAGTNITISGSTISSTDTNTTYSVGDGGLTQNNFTNTLKTKLDGIAASANNYVHPNHSGEVTSTADGATVIADNVVDEANLKVSNTPTNGYFLSAQSGNTGGMTWAEVDALPSQTSNSGKFLTTDGSSASWAVLDTDANSTSKGLYEHAHTISANYSITSGNNAMTAGPITINSGISVTIPTGSTWVIA